jgi:hypothetical protein
MSTSKIISLYPNIFGKPPFNPKESLMCFGFEVSEHWIPVIEEMLFILNKYLEDNNIKDFKILQIKEKFGSLSIYHNKYENIEITNIINQAIKKCYNICEECGAPGERKRRDGWIKVLCKNCEEI